MVSPEHRAETLPRDGCTAARYAITSGLPDDSREEDEWEVERWQRDLQGRVKRVRAVIRSTQALAETLAKDWQKAARFFTGYGISGAMFRYDVRATDIDVGADDVDWDMNTGEGTGASLSGRSILTLAGDAKEFESVVSDGTRRRLF